MTSCFTIAGEDYALITCFRCSAKFLMPWLLEETAHKLGRDHTFYCPNGHGQVYVEADATKLRRERDNLRQQMARAEDEKREALAARDAEHVEKVKAVAALERHKKRAAGGACPCCKRTFSDMARHMKTKHPDFAKDNVVNLGKATA